MNAIKSSDRDILIKDEKSSIYFKHLEWDTDFFARPCFFFDAGRTLFKGHFVSKHVASKHIISALEGSFTTAKIDTSMPHALVETFEDAGFRYILTEVTLEFFGRPADKNSEGADYKHDDVEIRKLDSVESLPFEDFGRSYSLTRFHIDNRVGFEKAQLLWVEYIRNYKPGARNHIFAAFINGEAAGVILANDNDDHIALFFVSVVEKFRGLKIGSKLIKEVTKFFNGRKILTGTQTNNVKALNFYISNGFTRVESTKTIMHKWG